MALKSIHLHRASATNGGDFVDSGSDLRVGDKADEISHDRAQDMIDTGGAISATEARAEAAKAEKADEAAKGDAA